MTRFTETLAFPKLLEVNLRLFDGEAATDLNTNTTTTAGLSAEMKTYYSNYLIDLAEPELVHDQFAQKHPIPAGGGRIIEFRQFDPLPELTTPLTEGVTPDGQSLEVHAITAAVDQYGGYVTLSDLLTLTSIDPMVVQATKLVASQAGATLDTITREVLAAGTNVQYSGGVTSRAALHYTSADSNCNLTVDDIKRAVRSLEVQSAPRIDGSYVAIIHPNAKYDLMKDPLWQYPHEYVDTEHIYANEIGRLYGVRFVESPRAKVFTPKPLTAGAAKLTVRSNVSSSATVPVKEKILDAEATALAGGRVVINGVEYTVSSATAGSAGSAALTLTASVASAAVNDVVSGAGAGAHGESIYATTVLADDAYGVTEISGGGLQHIVKQLGSAGTGDPLDQRATVGWKATKVARILVPQYMVRIESTATP